MFFGKLSARHALERRFFGVLKEKRQKKVHKPTEDEIISNTRIPQPPAVAAAKPFPQLMYPSITGDNQMLSYCSLSPLFSSALQSTNSYPRELGLQSKSLLGGFFHYLFRDSTRHLVEQVKNRQLAGFALLDGDCESGRSVTLMHAMNALNESGWITLYIPNAYYWIGGYYHYELNQATGMYDQLELSAEFLKLALILNRKYFDAMPMCADYSLHGGSATVPAQSSLSKMLEFALQPAQQPNSIKAASFFMDQLLGQSQIPVAIGVDQVNGFFGKTHYADSESRDLYPDSFSLLQLFLSAFRRRDCVTLGAPCTRLPLFKEFKNSQILNAIPDATRYSIEPLSREESALILAHYQKIGALYNGLPSSAITPL